MIEELISFGDHNENKRKIDERYERLYVLYTALCDQRTFELCAGSMARANAILTKMGEVANLLENLLKMSFLISNKFINIRGGQ